MKQEDIYDYFKLKKNTSVSMVQTKIIQRGRHFSRHPSLQILTRIIDGVA